MKPLVSICLPTRNGAKTITKTIKSILSQKYNNYELLISINQSSDKTYLICKNFQKRNKKIKIFIQKKLLSPTKNQNYIIKKAKGNFIVFIHDDDHWGTNFLNDGIETLLKDKSSVGVFGKIVRYEKKNVYKKENSIHHLNGNLEARLKRFLKYNYGDKFIFSIFNKKKFNNINFSQNIFSPEILFIFNALLVGKILNSNKMVYFKRKKNIRNIKEIGKFYTVPNIFFLRHAALVIILFKIIFSKSKKISVLKTFFLYRVRLFRYIFGTKLKNI